LCEHDPPIVTAGKRDTTKGTDLSAVTADFLKINRGGGLTWHGPGQITMYPIVNVQKLYGACKPAARIPILQWYTNILLDTMIATAANFNVHAVRDGVGVWATHNESHELRKIGSCGLHFSKWVSMGIGFNVCNDCANGFDQIVMCEMPGRRAASLVDCRPADSTNTVSVSSVGQKLAQNFAAQLHKDMELVFSDSIHQ
jgi:lipoyl(octanoyl) transferase